jgi:hypothetical protein
MRWSVGSKRCATLAKFVAQIEIASDFRSAIERLKLQAHQRPALIVRGVRRCVTSPASACGARNAWLLSPGRYLNPVCLATAARHTISRYRRAPVARRCINMDIKAPRYQTQYASQSFRNSGVNSGGEAVANRYLQPTENPSFVVS